ncbi:MAG: hypothetical protein LBR45_00175 [Bacteroidales bacterium]|jgi:hypothetical protein|nr:hypothetical protein [Bacteroidales bacterium]
MIKKYIIIFALCVFSTVKLAAQMSIEEINYRLETRPYSELEFYWDTPVLLPDSVQEKFAKALNREIPKAVVDSMLPHTPEQIQDVEEHILRNRRCKAGDTICIQEYYQKYITERKERYIRLRSNDIMPRVMILTAGNWHIEKAIPILKKAIGNPQYDQPSVLMALAKLGDDSVKQVLLDRYTLSYVLKNTNWDTTNDKALIYEFYYYDSIWTLREAVEVAMYLKNKEILLNIFDLLYIRGTFRGTIAQGFYYRPMVAEIVDEVYTYGYFYNFPNVEILEEICLNYRDAVKDASQRLSRDKRNREAKKELEVLLSTEYRTKLRNQIREWIIENVNF